MERNILAAGGYVGGFANKKRARPCWISVPKQSLDHASDGICDKERISPRARRCRESELRFEVGRRRLRKQGEIERKEG
jgi:hypothetical protein